VEILHVVHTPSHAFLESEQRARADAEMASRAKDDFLAMLGHELRNPLAPIITALQLMRLRRGSRLRRTRGEAGQDGADRERDPRPVPVTDG
jgi:signal transduction histidine kinase